MRLGAAVLLAASLTACAEAPRRVCGFEVERVPGWERSEDGPLSVELPDSSPGLRREAESRYVIGGTWVSPDMWVRYLYGSPFARGIREEALETSHSEVVGYTRCDPGIAGAARVATWSIRDYEEGTGASLGIHGIYLGAEWDEATGREPSLGVHDTLSVILWARDSTQLPTALRILGSVRLDRGVEW